MGTKTKQCVGGREARRGELESTEGRNRQERLPQVLCCRCGDETEELDLGEQRKRKRFVGSLPGFLTGMAWWVSRGCLLELGAGIKQRVRGRRLGGSWSAGSTGDVSIQEGRLALVFCCRAGERGGD